MNLNSKNSKSTQLFLGLTIVLAIGFVICSAFLINKVNHSQELVKEKVKCLHSTIDFRENVQDIIKQLSSESFNAIPSKEVDQLKSTVSSISELSEIQSILFNDGLLVKKQLSPEERVSVQQNLYKARKVCNQVIRSTRKELTYLSTVLSDYWTYTHISLIIACLLMVLLAAISLYTSKTKRLLLEEKLKNKLIFENSINIICSSNTQGVITDFNLAAQKAFGYTREEAHQLDFRVMYQNSEDIEKVEQALTEDGYFSGEVINKRKDGSTFVSYLAANNIYDESQNLIGTMGISRDISREKAKEQEFQNIVNNAQDIIYTTNTEGKFTFANSSGSSVMGYEKDELIGQFFTEMVHPEHIDYVRKFYTNQLRNKTKRSYLEFKGLTKKKETVWLGQNITTLTSPSNPDKVIGFQGVVRNINKRKIAERKLQKSEESFRVIVNTINDLFYLFDFRTDRFEYISPNTEQVLGIEQEFFFTGKSFFSEFVHNEDRAAAMKAEARLLKGESYNIEYRVINNGRTKWIQDRAFPIMNDSGRVISYSGVSRDITEVKTANLIIEQQNDEISQSISYAKNIQDSTLLDIEEITSIYEDCFIFFNPRDVLSGDFYLLDNFQTQDLGNLTAFVIADCTGHGVPGGMLSFLCNSLLREAFASPQVNSPSEVLDFAKEKLADLFRSNSDKHIYDGMDISLCAMSEDKSTIYYSGANLPLTIIRDGDHFEIRGDRQHVGYSRKSELFETQIIDIQKGDMIYLFSDGYQDQFGGERGKKYMKRRLKELLIRIHKLPLVEQYDIIKLEFHNWKGEHHQVDDVAVMGILV